MRGIATLALITSARIGELLALRWEACQGRRLDLKRCTARSGALPRGPGRIAIPI